MFRIGAGMSGWRGGGGASGFTGSGSWAFWDGAGAGFGDFLERGRFFDSWFIATRILRRPAAGVKTRLDAASATLGSCSWAAVSGAAMERSPRRSMPG